MNRLNLDFSIENNTDRAEFVQEYVKQTQFTIKQLTTLELETIANYILWGKDPITGKNIKQEKLVELETRSKTWDKHEAESLDALIETPTFRESQIRSLEAPRYKSPKTTFSRERALREAPAHLHQTYIGLWNRIDELDLIINFYDLAHGKRKNPPRPELLRVFSPDQIQELELRAESLTQQKYLKKRHLLVELRREQFAIKDTYSFLIERKTNEFYSEPQTSFLDTDISVLPYGLIGSTPLSKKLFGPTEPTEPAKSHRFPNPSDFTPEELSAISKLIWEPKKITLKFFDFRELEHLYNIFLLLEEFEDKSLDVPGESTLPQFLYTLDYYVTRADLPQIQKDILQLKIQKKKNQDIADQINSTYGKTYNANYISTIFKQKILKQIAATASKHQEVVENLFFPENFKQCKECGEILLLNADNFIRKAKSKDGFSARCKKCDKVQRLRRK